VRVLLDENLDRRLKGFLDPGVESATVQERGWGSKEDGELLELAQHEFDVLLTTDQGIPHQQNLSRFDLAIVLLEAKSNRLADLSPLMDEVNALLPEASPGTARRVVASVRRREGPPPRR
jgi:predicted nuclease of predicted toxin-antitoxin system